MNTLAVIYGYAVPSLAIAGSVVMGASVYISSTATPAPGSARANVYRYIELAALVFGKAKQTGILPAEPALDRLVGDVVAVLAPTQAQPTTSAKA